MVLPAVMACYLAAVLAIGFFARKRIRTQADYLAAGGTLGALVGGATLAATQMSAGTAIGSVGFHFNFGYNFAWAWLAIWAAYIVMTFLMAPKMKAFFDSHRALTIPDLLGTRYESNVIRVVAVLVLLFGFGLTIVAELVGGAFVLNVVLGTSRTTGVLIIAGVFITYTLLGGLFAVAYTDLMQMLVFVVGFAIAVPFVISRAGGFAGMNERLASIDTSLVASGMPVNALTAAAFSFFILLIGYPIIAVRFYSIRDVQTIRRAVGLAFIFQAIIAASVAVVGVSARVLFPNLDTPDLASPTIATQLLPPVLGGLLLAAILAAIQSTVSAVLLMLGSAISHDIVRNVMGKRLSERRQVGLTRLVVLIVGIVPVPFALNPVPLIQQIWIYAAALIGSAFAVPTLLGLVWKRGTNIGAVAAMVGGIGIAGIWIALGNPFGVDAVFVSVPVSLLAMVVLSYLSTPASPDALAPFFRGVRPVPGSLTADRR